MEKKINRSQLNISNNPNLTRSNDFIENDSSLIDLEVEFGKKLNVPPLHSPYFFLDILYLHARIKVENVYCQDIFDALSKLSFSSPNTVMDYNPLVLETHASAIKLASHMAVLLSNPAQRDNVSMM
jgi:hypothetical protein